MSDDSQTLRDIRDYLRKIWILLLIVLIAVPALALAGVIGVAFLGNSTSNKLDEVRIQQVRERYGSLEECVAAPLGEVTQEECDNAFPGG